MIIVESILTTIELIVVFRGGRGTSANWLEPKTKLPPVNLACPNL